MARRDEPDRTVGSVKRVLEIIQILNARDGAGVTEVANELDIAKSTAHSHLATLQQHEFLVSENDEYKTGLRFLEVGELARRRRDEYRSIEEKVKEISGETGERTQFIVPEHGRGVYLFMEIGANAVQTDAYIGKRIPLNASSAGKAILAHFPEEKLQSVFSDRGLEARTDESITDPAALRDELATIRERGYALNEDEATIGVRAVGVPLMGEGNEVLGALSVSAPAHRLKGSEFRERLPDYIMGVANELQLNIEFA